MIGSAGVVIPRPGEQFRGALSRAVEAGISMRGS